MLGSLISAGANLLGGILGNNQQEKNAERNIQLQKDFAQQGIRWKVEDAKAAGIHPLYALGANTTSFAPVSVGSDLSTGISNMGQDLSRAINSTRTEGERTSAYSKTAQELQLRNMSLQNDLLASQIAKINQTGTPPALPGSPTLIPGQGQTASGNPAWMKDFEPLLQAKPAEVVPGVPGSPQVEPGVITSVRHARTGSGYEPVPSTQMKQAIEDDMISEIMWSIKNRIAPMFGVNVSPPAAPLGKDEFWKYNPFAFEYQKRKGIPKEWFRR